MGDHQRTSYFRFKNPILTMAILLAILVTGALFTWLTVARTDREMRENLLQQTRLVAIRKPHKQAAGSQDNLYRTG